MIPRDNEDKVTNMGGGGGFLEGDTWSREEKNNINNIYSLP